MRFTILKYLWTFIEQDLRKKRRLYLQIRANIQLNGKF